MDTLVRHIPFVKEQQAFHLKLARRHEDQPWRRDLHVRSAAQFASLSEDLLSAHSELNRKAQATAAPTGRSGQATPLTPEDLEGLPDELLRELSISEADKLEFQIINIIDKAGGVMSLDRILIGLYKESQEIHKRNIMTSKLYRMVQKGLLFPVPPKKGVYSTEPPMEDQAAANSDQTSELQTAIG